MKQFRMYFTIDTFNGTNWNFNELQKDFIAKDRTDAINQFNQKYHNIDYTFKRIEELTEYIVCYTDVIVDSDYSYPDMSDDVFYALNEEEVKDQFKLRYPSSEIRQYHIDHIYTIEEFKNTYKNDSL